jgi:hypothetical protein
MAQETLHLTVLLLVYKTFGESNLLIEKIIVALYRFPPRAIYPTVVASVASAGLAYGHRADCALPYCHRLRRAMEAL